MHVSNGLKQFGRRAPETNGASVVASIIVTLLLFACAFVAMRTVQRSASRTEEVQERPVVVALTSPAPTVPPRRATASERTRSAAPSSVAPPTSTPRALPVPRGEPTVAPRDTASATPSVIAPVAPAPRAPATIPFGIAPIPSTLADTAMGARGGAPRQGAAASVGDRTPNTARFRDSISNARMREQARAWMAHEATGREKQEIETSQRLAAKVAERATTAGSREVHIPQGKGMNGVGAVSGGANIGLPLFSSGPSAAQRRINDSLDAEYQFRLRRLQDRIIARRDSARLDSLRRDSIARRARPPISDSRSAVASSLVQRPIQLSPP